LQREDDSEPQQSQRVTRSNRKRQIANRVVDDEVGCSNQDELNENRETQNDNVLVRKKRRGRQTDEAETRDSGASQSSTANLDLRRVTRNSARLM